MTDQSNIHLEAMQVALDEARLAFAHGDVPVGAVVLHNGEIIARRHNEREFANDPTAHAEVLALRDASQKLGSWRLDECTLVVTLEPCVMCMGALYWSQLDRVVFGASDLKRGFASQGVQAHPKTKIQGGVLAEDSGTLMERFFKNKR